MVVMNAQLARTNAGPQYSKGPPGTNYMQVGPSRTGGSPSFSEIGVGGPNRSGFGSKLLFADAYSFFWPGYAATRGIRTLPDDRSIDRDPPSEM